MQNEADMDHMSVTINTNVNSLTAQRNLTTSQGSLSQSIQRLSSGLRINSAKDDAAGLAISERFTSQIRGLNQAARNANDGISLAQTAEGALKASGDILQRVRELAVQSANATNSASDRQALQQEVGQLVAELERTAQSTEFNGQKLLDGGFGTAQFQVGANAGQTIVAQMLNARTTNLGGSTFLSGSGIVAKTNGTTSSFGGGLVVNGTTISTTGATDVASVVAAISAQSTATGVTATRSTTNINSATYSQSMSASTVQINGTSITIAANSSIDTVASQINAVKDQTGVSVTVSGSRLTFTSEGGADLRLTDDPDMMQGVFSNINGQSVGPNADVTLTAGITLTSESLSGIDVAEGSGSTASDLQLLASDITIETTSTIASVSLGGGSQSVSDAYIGSVSVGGGTLTLNNVIVESLSIGGGTINITNSIIKNFSMGGGVVNASGSSISNQSIGGGTLNNSAPVFAGSPSPATSTILRVSNLDVSTVNGATTALQTVDLALQKISSERAKLGALQSRFETTVNNLQVTSENLSASRSRILDADFAAETAALSKAQILQQAGTAMVAQANQLPQGVLALLR